MIEPKKHSLIRELKELFPDEVILTETLPLAYYKNTDKVKAIVLGCDPSNQHSMDLKYAFGIICDIPLLKQFFRGIEENLRQIEITVEDVYVQNLCQNYFKNVTSENKIWAQAAEYWIPVLIDELSIFDPSVPVLLTSSYLYKVLKLGSKFPPRAYYDCIKPVPIPAAESKLNRPLIPFYRNRRKIDYHLSNSNWPQYQKRLIDILHDN